MKDVFSGKGYSLPNGGIELKNEGNETLLRVNISAVEVSGDENKDTEPQFECDLYRVKNPVTYGSVVAAIVRDKYSADEVEAIVLNKADATAEHKAEFAALQEWRKHAKEIAHKVCG